MDDFHCMDEIYDKKHLVGILGVGNIENPGCREAIMEKKYICKKKDEGIEILGYNSLWKWFRGCDRMNEHTKCWVGSGFEFFFWKWTIVEIGAKKEFIYTWVMDNFFFFFRVYLIRSWNILWLWKKKNPDFRRWFLGRFYFFLGWKMDN